MLLVESVHDSHTAAMMDDSESSFFDKFVQKRLAIGMAHDTEGKYPKDTPAEISTPLSCRKEVSHIPSIQSAAYAHLAVPLHDAAKVEQRVKTRPQLSKSSALSLQMELLTAYTMPGFQRQLHELVRKYGADDRLYHLAFRQHVRRVQFTVIPSYGFEASEDGVAELEQAFRKLADDADIFVNAEAIKEALFGAARQKQFPESPPRGILPKPSSVERIVNMLRDILVEYSQPAFQHEVYNLMCSESSDLYAAGGYYHLPGRAELALKTQADVLPLYGFEPTREGVKEMIFASAQYLTNPEVAGLFDAINSKLGMSHDACRRFRNLALGMPKAK